MIVKLLTEHHLKFLSLKQAAEARPSLHMSKCHIVGNHMSRLISDIFEDIGRVVVEVYIVVCIFLILLYLLV